MAQIPPLTPPPAPAAQAVALPQVTLPRPPEALLRLAVGVVLEAPVVAVTRGAVTVTLPEGGNVSLRLATPIPGLGEGSRLTLQVSGASPALATLRLLAVDGQPPTASPAATPRPGLPGQPTAGLGQASAPPAGTPLQTAAANAGQAITLSLDRGSSRPLPATILDTSPTPGGGPPLGRPGEVLTVTLRPAPEGNATPTRPTAPGTPPPQPPSASAPAPSQGGPNLALTGEVTRPAGDVGPVIRTPAGTLRIDAPVDLPVGGRVVVEISTRPLAAAEGLARPLVTSAPSLVSSLTQALEVLNRVDPAASRALAAALPQDGPRLAASLAAFTRATREVDPRRWPGEEPLNALRRAGQETLAARLTEDIGDASGRARDGGGEWRVFAIPFADGRDIDAVRMAVRRQEEDGGEGPGEDGDGARFLVDLSLSRLGGVQIDGLIRRKAKSFDVILRSHQPVPDDAQVDLRRIFFDAIGELGMTGGVSFVVTRRFIAPIAQPVERPGTLI